MNLKVGSGRKGLGRMNFITVNGKKVPMTPKRRAVHPVGSRAEYEDQRSAKWRHHVTENLGKLQWDQLGDDWFSFTLKGHRVGEVTAESGQYKAYVYPKWAVSSRVLVGKHES